MQRARPVGNLKPVYSTSVEDFQECLKGSKRVLALLGAGMSASSGLPTFRGPGGLWRTHHSTDLATPEAFDDDPGLVWQFYNYRRHMALSVKPNPAHFALAELSRKMPQFMTLTQNVDGLSQRAHHPPEQLQLLHGTLFKLTCWNESCDYEEVNFTDPVAPALAPPESGEDPTSDAALQKRARELDISDPAVAIPKIQLKDLPQCPKCQKAPLRPGVVWFGEALPEDVIAKVDNYLKEPEPVDLIMVIGTSSQVYPAAGYVHKARQRGARVCVINMDQRDTPSGGWYERDWFFKGDAAELVPKLLEPVIGAPEVWLKEAKI